MSEAYSLAASASMCIVMLNLLPQLKMPQANTISTISSSVKVAFKSVKNASVTV